MHELAIISSIVSIAEEEVQKAGGHGVESIELEIGELAGIEWHALDFAWEVGVQKSVLENAQLEIEKVEGEAKCFECRHEFNIKTLYDSCPKCGSYFNEIKKGKELRVKALTVI
jgi:hydrogenase nickel incorporation protein HypA/HybF